MKYQRDDDVTWQAGYKRIASLENGPFVVSAKRNEIQPPCIEVSSWGEDYEKREDQETQKSGLVFLVA